MNATPGDSSSDFTGVIFHWFFGSLGIFLKILLPVLISWTDSTQEIAFERGWVYLILAGIAGIVCGGLNYTLPRTPPMALNSIAFGVASYSIFELIKNGT